MFKTVIFIIYCAVIPIVPLYGVEYYRRNDNELKKLCCWGLFVLQSIISIGSIIGWLG